MIDLAPHAPACFIRVSGYCTCGALTDGVSAAQEPPAESKNEMAPGYVPEWAEPFPSWPAGAALSVLGVVALWRDDHCAAQALTGGLLASLESSIP